MAHLIPLLQRRIFLLSNSFAVSTIPDTRIIFWANVLCVTHFLLVQEDVQAIKAEDSVESDSKGQRKGGVGDTGTWMGKFGLFGDKIKHHVSHYIVHERS